VRLLHNSDILENIARIERFTAGLGADCLVSWFRSPADYIKARHCEDPRTAARQAGVPGGRGNLLPCRCVVEEIASLALAMTNFFPNLRIRVRHTCPKRANILRGLARAADHQRGCPEIAWPGRAACAGTPRRSIRGLGNVLRHAYDDVDPSLIW
jgi:hypothetical protein